MFKIVAVIFLTFAQSAFARNTLCEVIKLKKCNDFFGGGGGSTGPSLSRGISFPTTSSVLAVNPAKLNTDRGIGVETVNYHGTYAVGFASGTGVVGGGFSATTTEGQFFGNTTKESEEEYFFRKKDRNKFKEGKFTVATAIKILGSKKKKAGYWSPTVNLGLIGTHNDRTDEISGGLGTSFMFGPLTASVARFKETYKETLTDEIFDHYVNTYSGGIKLFNLALEHTVVDNKNDTGDIVRLNTATMYFNYFILTYGQRIEESPYQAIDFETMSFTDERTKEDVFYGIQIPIGANFLVGFFYNYYLNRNGSFSLTGFF